MPQSTIRSRRSLSRPRGRVSGQGTRRADPNGLRVGARLARHGVTANEVTVVGMVLAGVTGVAIGLDTSG